MIHIYYLFFLILFSCQNTPKNNQVTEVKTEVGKLDTSHVWTKLWVKSSLSNSISNLAFLDYVQFKVAIWGLGYFKGNIEKFEFKPEICKTTDLRNWTTISKSSNLPKRFFYHPFVFDNKIWLLGCNRNGQFSSQVLLSTDGKTWQTQIAPWLPRGGGAATVHTSKIYMTGGKYGGTPNYPDFRYDNDVWTLEKK